MEYILSMQLNKFVLQMKNYNEERPGLQMKNLNEEKLELNFENQ